LDFESAPVGEEASEEIIRLLELYSSAVNGSGESRLHQS
jgi:hypothetical protein